MRQHRDVLIFLTVITPDVHWDGGGSGTRGGGREGGKCLVYNEDKLRDDGMVSTKRESLILFTISERHRAETITFLVVRWVMTEYNSFDCFLSGI